MTPERIFRCIEYLMRKSAQWHAECRNAADAAEKRDNALSPYAKRYASFNNIRSEQVDWMKQAQIACDAHAILCQFYAQMRGDLRNPVEPLNNNTDICLPGYEFDKNKEEGESDAR